MQIIEIFETKSEIIRRELKLSEVQFENIKRHLYSYQEIRQNVLRAAQRNFSKFNECYLSGIERVLEVGSGAGFLARNWPEFRGLWIETDEVELFLNVAKEKLPDGTFVCADFYKLPFSDKSFDAVIEFNSYNSSQDLETAISEASRVLRSGGLFLHIMDLPAAREEGSEVTKEAVVNRNNTLTEKLVQLLSIYFDSHTVSSGISKASYKGRRAEEQRKTGNFLFFKTPTGYGDDSNIFDHNDMSYPAIIWRIHKHMYERLKKISPKIARYFEPPCIEFSVMSYVISRK